MYQFSDAVWDEYWTIREEYSAQDPDGEFDPVEWKAFFEERASKALKQEVRAAEEAYREARIRGVRI